MHVAVGVDALGDHADAVGERHQRHPLRLQVGREARVRLRRDVGRRAGASAPGRAAGSRSSPRPRSMRDARAAHRRSSSAVRCSGRQPSTRTRAAGDRARRRRYVPASMRSGITGDSAPCSASTPSISMRRRADAVDLRAHRVQAVAEVDDLGLAGGAVDAPCARARASRPSSRCAVPRTDEPEGRAEVDLAARAARRGGASATT